MYTHILIPTDGSALAGKAVQHGSALASAIGARVSVLTVTTPFHVFTLDPDMGEDSPSEYRERIEKQVARTLSAAGEVMKAAGVAFDLLAAEHGHPYQAIIDTAKARGCDLVVMASHGRRGIAGLVIGSETVKVLTHSKVPVLVHR
jgi:nucleotide-binding universal stress UspA family protein